MSLFIVNVSNYYLDALVKGTKLPIHCKSSNMYGSVNGGNMLESGYHLWSTQSFCAWYISSIDQRSMNMWEPDIARCSQGFSVYWSFIIIGTVVEQHGFFSVIIVQCITQVGYTVCACLILWYFCRFFLLMSSCMLHCHECGDAIMTAMASQTTGVSIVCTIVCSGTDQRKHQSSASLAFVRGIHR